MAKRKQRDHAWLILKHLICSPLGLVFLLSLAEISFSIPDSDMFPSLFVWGGCMPVEGIHVNFRDNLWYRSGYQQASSVWICTLPIFAYIIPVQDSPDRPNILSAIPVFLCWTFSYQCLIPERGKGPRVIFQGPLDYWEKTRLCIRLVIDCNLCEILDFPVLSSLDLE